MGWLAIDPDHYPGSQKRERGKTLPLFFFGSRNAQAALACAFCTGFFGSRAAALLCAFNLAHLIRWALAILFRAAADIRRGFFAACVPATFVVL
jgi:hypothetical protein